MEKKYYYLASYANDYDNYYASLAQNTKVGYIISCLEQLGVYVNIFSTAVNKKRGFHFSKTISLTNHSIHYFSSFTSTNHILRRMGDLYKKLQVLLFLAKRKNNDVVIVYHDIPYLFLLNIFKAKRKFKLVYEVEELYSHAWEQTEEKVEYEKELLKNADAYIFVTEELNRIINVNNKPYVVVAGSYSSVPKIGEKKDDGLIHCVYAGTFDTTKGGAFSAIASAKYLDSNYRIHILGFGTENQIKSILQQIELINVNNDCIVTYEGCLSGNDYTLFLQSCHIGLNTQNPNRVFNISSFPSKIPVYLANGLNVVSVYTDEISSFKGANEIDFYYNDSPQDIANAIIKSSKNLKDGRNVIANLNELFIDEFKSFLDKV